MGWAGRSARPRHGPGPAQWSSGQRSERVGRASAVTHGLTLTSNHIGVIHPPARPHRVLDARRGGPARRAGGQGGRRRAAGARHHRPRQHVRDARVLQGVPQAGHQAGHRHRGLHGPRPPQRAPDPPGPRRRLRWRHRGRPEALLPPHAAGRERDRLPQPHPARQPGLPRGLLLQAAPRLGAARDAPRGPHRHHRLPRWPRPAVAAAGRRARARWRRPAGCRTSSAATTCSSSSRTTACRPSATPTRS